MFVVMLFAAKIVAIALSSFCSRTGWFGELMLVVI